MTLLEQYFSQIYYTDKQIMHCYIEQLYNKLFDDKSITNLLEIGAMYGGSALLWRDYFTDARIDIIDKDRCDFIVHQYRINHIVADAYTEELVATLGNYDIIIDDGPHTLDSMFFVIDHYIKLLKPNGVCVIEDIQEYEWFDKLISKIPTGYSYEIVDLRHIINRYDDMVLIIKKVI